MTLPSSTHPRHEDVMERLVEVIGDGTTVVVDGQVRVNPGVTATKAYTDAGLRLARFIASPESVEAVAMVLEANTAPLCISDDVQERAIIQAQAVLTLLAQKALDDGS